MSKAIYAGSFDPITNGHLWVIQRGLELFEQVIILVAVNNKKTPMFSADERCEMIREIHQDTPNVVVDQLENKFVVDYAHGAGASHLLRGLRNETDYQYERELCSVNATIRKEIYPVFLMPPPEIIEVSSSTVKALVGIPGWEEVVKQYVPASVMSRFLARAYES